jgi:tetratricopeptide (TPR) repeat protein
MRLVEIYRARFDGRTGDALAAAKTRLAEMDFESRSSPGWQEMWFQLMHLVGDCYLDLHEYEQAEARFDHAYRVTGSGIALSNRAYALWRQGRLSEAKQDYVAALRHADALRDPEVADVDLRNLAGICLEMGDIDEASRHISKARDLVGDTWEVEASQREIDHYRSSRLG